MDQIRLSSHYFLVSSSSDKWPKYWRKATLSGSISFSLISSEFKIIICDNLRNLRAKISISPKSNQNLNIDIEIKPKDSILLKNKNIAKIGKNNKIDVNKKNGNFFLIFTFKPIRKYYYYLYILFNCLCLFIYSEG